MIRLLIAALSLKFSACALETLFFANPARTDEPATLSLMISVEQTIPALTGTLRITSPTDLTPSVACELVEPIEDRIRTCSLITTKTLEITFEQDLTQSGYIQIKNFVTPQTTVYTGFEVETNDSFGRQLEKVSGVMLNSLQPQKLAAGILRGSERPGALTDFILSVTPVSQCSSCVLQISGPGLSQASCPDCTTVDASTIRLSTRLTKGSESTITLSDCTNPQSAQVPDSYTVKIVDPQTGGLAESTTLSLQLADSSVISDLSVVMTGNTQVGMYTSLDVSFYVPLPVPSGCVIDIRVPSQFSGLSEYLRQVKVSGVFSEGIQAGRSLQFQVIDI